MNHFFALELSDTAREVASHTAEVWANLLLPEQIAKWTAPSDYHLTLHFLGDLPEEAQADLIALALPVAASCQPLEIQLTEAGVFPNPRQPRVLWRGIRLDASLLSLVEQLREALDSLGYPAETRPYRPHVTLARCRTFRQGGNWAMPSEQVFVNWLVKRFVLMQTLPPESRANEAKGRYNIVHPFPLGNPHL